MSKFFPSSSNVVSNTTIYSHPHEGYSMLRSPREKCLLYYFKFLLVRSKFHLI
jgi:hypothetical protein